MSIREQSPIDRNMVTILRALSEWPRDEASWAGPDGPKLSELTGLSPDDLNDSVNILHESGLVEWIQPMGTFPYDFAAVRITSRGRYEYERLKQQTTESAQKEGEIENESVHQPQLGLPATPIGSPYGFTPEDWETVARHKAKTDTLYVVMGSQWKSGHYDSAKLKKNVEAMFRKAVEEYNKLPGVTPCTLHFRALGAGYGGHLFNAIARDIIGADIAVFETSDLNPNVMIELGVALTWGTRVLPIKAESQPKPPSDVSGQTYADYRDSARVFTDPDHDERLATMVEYALRGKGRGRERR